MRALRVLIVEDREQATSAMVRRLGHVSLSVAGRASALDQSATWNPDLLLVDLTSPIIDGVELAQRIRQTPETAPKPLIALTGYMDGEHRRQAIDAGFDEFLPKPFKPEELAEILSRVEVRIVASNAVAEQTREIAKASRVLNQKLREGLAEYRQKLAEPTRIRCRAQQAQGGLRLSEIDKPEDAESLRNFFLDQGLSASIDAECILLTGLTMDRFLRLIDQANIDLI